jgi:hypothetical protein
MRNLCRQRTKIPLQKVRSLSFAGLPLVIVFLDNEVGLIL